MEAEEGGTRYGRFATEEAENGEQLQRKRESGKRVFFSKECVFVCYEE